MVYVFVCRQTEFTCVCVYIYIYTHGNYIYVGVYSHICTPSLQMGVRQVYMSVCIDLSLVFFRLCFERVVLCLFEFFLVVGERVSVDRPARDSQHLRGFLCLNVLHQK